MPLLPDTSSPMYMILLGFLFCLGWKLCELVWSLVKSLLSRA